MFQVRSTYAEVPSYYPIDENTEAQGKEELNRKFTVIFNADLGSGPASSALKGCMSYVLEVMETFKRSGLFGGLGQRGRGIKGDCCTVVSSFLFCFPPL